MQERAPGDSARQGTAIRLGAVAAVALAVAFVVWLVVRGDERSPATTAVGPTATQGETDSSRPGVVVAATVQNLKALAKLSGAPIYWAGAKPGVTYELTQTPEGRIFIRYLPRGVAIGDRRGNYLIVGTYPVTDAYEAVQRAGEASGAVIFSIARGGLAVYNQSAATNVYFAYPDTHHQIEVYDPSPARARRLVSSGAIRPIR